MYVARQKYECMPVQMYVGLVLLGRVAVYLFYLFYYENRTEVHIHKISKQAGSKMK